eukprot:1140627-Pelagomonas_calceolata.AAC.2
MGFTCESLPNLYKSPMPTLSSIILHDAHKRTLTRRAIEIKNTQHSSGALGPHAARNPSDPHWLHSHTLVRETHGSLSQRVSFSYIDVVSVLDTKQVPHGSQISAPHIIVQTPCQSNPCLQKEELSWS